MPIRTGRDTKQKKAAERETKPQKKKPQVQKSDTMQYGYGEENQKQNKPVDVQGYSNTLDDEEDDFLDTTADTARIKIFAGITAVVIVVVVFFITRFVSSGSSGDSKGIVVSNETATPLVSPTAEESFVQGDNNYADSEDNQPLETLNSSSEFVKDLKGEDVPVNYSVQSRHYVTAHVSYVAKRALIDEGMEMYWIDITYRKKKYRLQVPFYYFKDFEEEGICRVEIEVLDLENGSQIISYMHVIDEDTE